MRPLPRLLAFCDDRVALLEDLGVRAAAIAAAGPAVALVARRPHGSTDQLATLAARFVALAAPPMAAVFVTGRPDLALAVGASGVVLRRDDLSPEEMLTDPALRAGTPLLRCCSIHSEVEAERAAAAGADALIAGAIWPTSSHPERPAAGTVFLSRIAAVGLPTYAIGGVTPDRAAAAIAAGAWGIAAVSAVWDAMYPYQAAKELIAACTS